MLPCAPPRLSMMTCCPQPSASLAPRMRPKPSVPPPGGKGTMKRTGRSGNVCAIAVFPTAPKKKAQISAPAEHRAWKARGEKREAASRRQTVNRFLFDILSVLGNEAQVRRAPAVGGNRGAGQH